MKGEAEAICHGAATIVNAMATGNGAAIGIDLWTKAKVRLVDDCKEVEGTIVSDPTENQTLITSTVKRVLRHFSLEDKLGAKVETWSNIPIARGLKSSSTAANAITLATVAALGKKLDDLTIVKLGVDGAVDANVTVTGAFDDACASYFGGIVITDNLNRIIVKRFEAVEGLTVLFHVPVKKSYTVDSNINRLKALGPLLKIAYKETLKGNHWKALTLNGIICSSALGWNVSIAVDALMRGAVAAGLSGKGPAVTAIVSSESIDLVKDVWQSYEGEVLETQVNCDKARVVS